MKTWMIRAGEKAGYIDSFIEHNLVAIGWKALGEIAVGSTREQIDTLVKQIFPDKKRGWQAISTGQVYRFLNEIKTGDTIITYDPGRRVYHVGEISSDPVYKSEEQQPRQRTVKWAREIQRDDFSQPTKNTLGAISTLFLLSETAANEVQTLMLRIPAQSGHPFWN